uniref:Myb_Cef domain-containing protein n=1 Tax=Elaeophora elaphi TaxID=1147741 RepID=A0A0R3S107_9BILA
MPMTVDGTPDRDTIFKELRSRAQMQQQMSQQSVLPAVMLPPLVPSVIPPAQINSDEIFRELQHRALRMQIEQDRLEAEQRAEKEKNVDSEIPVLMIADTFPRRPVEVVAEQTSEEVAGATTTVSVETTTRGANSDNSSESLSTFFNFFDKEIHEGEITNSGDKEQEIALKSDNVKVEPGHSAEEDTFGDVSVDTNDGVGLVVKPDETAPQVNFIQELATSEAPVSMDTSEEVHSKLFKSAVFRNEPDERDGGDMLGTPVRLLENP